MYARPSVASRVAVTQKRYATAGVKTDQYEQGKKDHALDKSGLDVQSDTANKAKSWVIIDTEEQIRDLPPIC